MRSHVVCPSAFTVAHPTTSDRKLRYGRMTEKSFFGCKNSLKMSIKTPSCVVVFKLLRIRVLFFAIEIKCPHQVINERFILKVLPGSLVFDLGWPT